MHPRVRLFHLMRLFVFFFSRGDLITIAMYQQTVYQPPPPMYTTTTVYQPPPPTVRTTTTTTRVIRYNRCSLTPYEAYVRQEPGARRISDALGLHDPPPQKVEALSDSGREERRFSIHISISHLWPCAAFPEKSQSTLSLRQ